MPPPAVVRELVERFESNRESYRSDQYNEAQLREEFLNPFFEALGWDVYNRKGYAEAYKEVIHEDADQGRRPDEGPRLLLPRRRRRAELLRRGQEALGRYPRGGQPGLSNCAATPGRPSCR